MLPLPTELWIPIFQAIRDFDPQNLYRDPSNRDPAYRIAIDGLKSSSLVCQAFRAMAQPLLFEHVSLGNGLDRSPEHALVHARSVEELFDAREESTAWTKSVYIRVTNPRTTTIGGFTYDATWRQQIEPLISRIFVRMRGLQSVEMEHLTISSAIYAHLYNSPSLVTFRCWNVCAGEDLTSIDHPIDSLHLSRLTLNDIHSGSRDTLAIPAMARLALSPSLKTLCISSTVAPYTCDMISRSDPNALSGLDEFEVTWLADVDTSPIVDVLVRCDRLTRVMVRGWSNQRQILPIQLPAGALPCLAAVEGPWEVAEAFTPGRPVQEIRGHRPFQSAVILTEDVLHPFSQGSVPLRYLNLKAVRWGSETLRALAKLFPELEELNVWLSPDRYNKVGRLEPAMLEETYALQHLRNLSVIDIHEYSYEGEVRSGRNDFEEQQVILHGFCRSCPVLETAAFRLTNKWTRSLSGDWRMTDAF